MLSHLCYITTYRHKDMEFVVRTDASNVVIGSVLMQSHYGAMHREAYGSRKFTERERKYTVEERMFGNELRVQKLNCY